MLDLVTGIRTNLGAMKQPKRNDKSKKKIIGPKKIIQAIYDQMNNIKVQKDKAELTQEDMGKDISLLTSRSYRRWIATLNYPTYKEFMDLKAVSSDRSIDKMIVSYEFGKLGRSAHLQIYFEFTKPKSPVQFFGIKRIHFSKAIKNLQTNVVYVSGIDKNYEVGTILILKNIDLPPAYKRADLIKMSMLHPWQQKIYNLLSRPTHQRIIYWFFEPEGGIGKTALSRLLVMTCGALRIANARPSSIAFSIAFYTYSSKTYPPVIILDIPRAAMNRVDYGTIENVKDSLIYSDRFASQSVIGKHMPHVIIFSNEYPDTSVFSKDRLVIMEIKDNDLELVKADLRYIGDINMSDLTQQEKLHIEKVKGFNFFELESEHYIPKKRDFGTSRAKLSDFKLSKKYKANQKKLELIER